MTLENLIRKLLFLFANLVLIQYKLTSVSSSSLSYSFREKMDVNQILRKQSITGEHIFTKIFKYWSSCFKYLK